MTVFPRFIPQTHQRQFTSKAISLTIPEIERVELQLFQYLKSIGFSEENVQQS